MAFRFGDPGGRMYTSAGTALANILTHWTGSNNTSNWTVSSGNGRTTGSCLRNSGGTYLVKTIDAQATWGVAFAFKFSNLPTVGFIFPVCGFDDATTIQVELRLNADGTLSVTRNGGGTSGNGTVLGTTATALSVATWYHIELKTTINNSTGTVALYVDGVQKLNLSSQNTRNSSNSSANQFRIGAGLNGSQFNFTGSSQTVDYDDIIVYDGQSTDQAGNADITGPIGDCGLYWSLPTGAGTTTQFTPDTGSNYARVNETTPDGDTSYVQSSTVGNIDTYAVGDLPGTASAVKSIAVVHYARKNDPGSRSMVSTLRTGGTNYNSATTISLADSYQYWWGGSWGLNPNTTSTWSVSDINGLEAGQKVTA